MSQSLPANAGEMPDLRGGTVRRVRVQAAPEAVQLIQAAMARSRFWRHRNEPAERSYRRVSADAIEPHSTSAWEIPRRS
jgi:hypothetical protein